VTALTGHVLGGRYRIESLIGRGGMADVYRATDTMLARTVAVKVLSGRADGDGERFLREARSMAKLNHRNIVAVYDAGRSDDHSYIVMELVEGRTLAAIPPAELTVHTALRHYIEILDALQFAHENGVFHRDVKPTNVMVLPNGSLKVMDFGLARNASEMSSATTAGEIVGTIAYLPPERFLGKPADARGDLYSVGVMLYETFTGTVPFKSETDDLVAVIFGHVNTPPQPPRSINRAVPVEVETIVLRLLEKEPERRYQSAAELADELRTLLGPGEARPAPVPLGTAAAAVPETARRSHRTSSVDAARDLLAKTFSRTRPADIGYSETLAGMLAARKRDYPEAGRAYAAALAAFAEAGNELERAKTALKYATMILQKNSESDAPSGGELTEAAETLSEALPSFRGRGLMKELAEGERLLYALGLQLARTR
jgi:serine/threonine protein kinase